MKRFALIGCGVIGQVHAWALAHAAGAELAVTCDIVAERAVKLADQHGAKAITDYHEALADPRIDAISIALPHCDHARVFEEALAAGKHVICEKPLGIHPAELARMIDLAKRTDRVTAGVFQHRFSPVVETLAAYVQRGALGKLTGARIDFVCERTAAYYDADAWRGTWAGEGGGVLINQAIHTVDLLSVFLGRPVTVDGRAERRRLTNIEVEDHASARVDYGGGVEAEILVRNVEAGGWRAELTLTGTRGRVVLDGSEAVKCVDSGDDELRGALQRAQESRQPEQDVPGKPCYSDMHKPVFADFVSAMTSGGRPRVSIADAAIANELVLAVYHSTATQGRVRLPMTGYQQPRFTGVTATVSSSGAIA